LRPRLWQYLGGAIRGEGGVALLVNGVSDHVHILARLRPDKAVADVMRSIKANSSGGGCIRTAPSSMTSRGRQGMVRSR
jgi:hypothetical protein